MLNTLVNTCTQSIQFSAAAQKYHVIDVGVTLGILLFWNKFCSCAQEHAKTWEGKHPFAMPFL